MSTIRFVHCADLHLGAKFSMLPRQVADARRQNQRDAFAAAVDIALDDALPADVFLIAGDSFDAATPPLRELSFFNSQLRRLADNGVRTFIIPGNHDQYQPGSWWDRSEPPAEAVFKKPGLHKHIVPVLDLTIAALPADPTKSSVNLLRDLELNIETDRSILLMHGTWLNFGRDECEVEYHPFSSDDLAELPVDYVALGHFHGVRDATPLDGPTAFYPGTPEAIGFGTGCEDGGCVIVGSIAEDGNVAVEQRKVARGRHKRLRIDCTNHSPESLERLVADDLARNDYVLAQLSGIPCAETAVAAGELAERLQGGCAYIDITAEFNQIGEMPKDNVFFVKFREAVEQKLVDAPEEDKPKWRRVLELGTVAFLSA